MVVRARMVAANGLKFGLLEAGEDPLAALAKAGFHAVAPFLRGYAPTAVPDDACYRRRSASTSSLGPAVSRHARHVAVRQVT
jgi:hypothetical protein